MNVKMSTTTTTTTTPNRQRTQDDDDVDDVDGQKEIFFYCIFVKSFMYHIGMLLLLMGMAHTHTKLREKNDDFKQ